MAIRDQLFQKGTYASAPKALLALPTKTLSAGAKLVWMAIVERFGDNEDSFPGAGKIAKDTGLSRRGVQEAVEQLARLKLLTVVPPDDEHSSNRYRLTEFASALSSLAHSVHHPSARSSPPTSEPSAPGVAHSVRPNYRINNPTKTTQENYPSEGACGPGDPSGRSTAPDVSTQADGGSSRSTPASSSSKKRRAADQKLGRPCADEVRSAILSDRTGTATAVYWLFGSGAVGRMPEQCAGLTPSGTNWARASGDWNRPDPDCKPNALAAFAWWKITCLRAAEGQPLAMPAFEKLVGVVKNLAAAMGPEQTAAHIVRVAGRWAEIKAALAWMTMPPALDETFFAHPKIVEHSNRLAAGQSITPNQTSTYTGDMYPSVAAATASLAEQLKTRPNRDF
ncbi:MAG TPA: helix-turn-helix domain-containing protein [Tepidisphaeraceae bacterium]|nr:helix-turn-helix domain-containing protein [Tepidisphaeraceae bacterium]